jgi:hypothetical protein
MDRLSVELHYYFFGEERPTQVTLADVLKIGKERIFGLVFVLCLMGGILNRSILIALLEGGTSLLDLIKN